MNRNQYNGRDGNGYQPMPPEPPPMRIGQRGDTIDRHGVRRKADGSLRTWYAETVWNWVFIVLFALALAGVFWIGTRA